MTVSFLIGDNSETARWRSWVPSAIRLIEEGSVIRRDLFETTGTYAILRPLQRSNAKLHIRFTSDNAPKGYRSISLHYEDRSNDTLHLHYDLGMPEGTFKIGEMEDQQAFRARLIYIAAILRSIMEMPCLNQLPATFGDDAATIIGMFHSTAENLPIPEEGEKMQIRSGPSQITFTAKAVKIQNRPPTPVQITYPRDCKMGDTLPIMLRARVVDGGLVTSFEPALLSGRSSNSPIDVMAAIANVSSLTGQHPEARGRK